MLVIGLEILSCYVKRLSEVSKELNGVRIDLKQDWCLYNFNIMKSSDTLRIQVEWVDC